MRHGTHYSRTGALFAQVIPGPMRTAVSLPNDLFHQAVPEPRGSEPGYRRPALIIQANSFNSSRIQTIILAVISSNLRLGSLPGNVLITRRVSGLPNDSVVNVW